MQFEDPSWPDSDEGKKLLAEVQGGVDQASKLVPPSAELLKRAWATLRAIEQSPGRAVQQHLTALQRTRHLFDGNSADLEETLNSEAGFIGYRQVFAPFGERSEAELHRDEVDRRFYNYAHARNTLIDVTRNTLRSLDLFDGTDWYRDVYTPIMAPLQTPKFVFLKELRNYIGHYRSVASQERHHLLEDGTVRRDYLIDKDLLRGWRKWTKPSLNYLDQPGQFVDIRQIVADYRIEVDRFYELFDAAVREEKAAELAETCRLQALRITLPWVVPGNEN